MRSAAYARASTLSTQLPVHFCGIFRGGLHKFPQHGSGTIIVCVYCKSFLMSDNKQQQDGRDDARVDSKDKSEVEYLHRQHPNFTHAQIVEAVEKYGPLRKDIEAHLRGGR